MNLKIKKKMLKRFLILFIIISLLHEDVLGNDDDVKLMLHKDVLDNDDKLLPLSLFASCISTFLRYIVAKIKYELI